MYTICYLSYRIKTTLYHTFSWSYNSEKDSCGGDSGGPLITKKKVGGKDVYTAIGITSWGSKHCGSEDEYGVYTNVAYYNDWILNTIY